MLVALPYLLIKKCQVMKEEIRLFCVEQWFLTGGHASPGGVKKFQRARTLARSATWGFWTI